MNERDESLDIIEILAILRKQIKLVLIVPVLCALAGFSLSQWVISPQYESDAILIINVAEANQSTEITYDQITAAQQLVNTYSVILKSDTVLNKVISNLNLKTDAKKLEKSIDINGVSQTSVINITVRAKDPQTAADIANEITKVAPTIIVDTVKAGRIEIFSPAKKTDKPVSPNKLLYTIIAFIGGLAITIIISLAKEMMNQNITSVLDIKKYLNCSVLGVIPKIKKRYQRPRSESKTDNTKDFYPSILKDTAFEFAESFNCLRTNICYSTDRQFRKIMISSCSGNEGKSTVAINLAIALANAKNHVLLIDCNLRKPDIKNYMQIESIAPGLTSAIAGKAKIEECIIHQFESGLDVITSGPVPYNPAEMLGSAKMAEIIRMLSEKYEYILFDTPPVLAVTDAAVLSKLSDGVIYVIRHNQTKIEDAVIAKSNLENVGAKLIGTVLNASIPVKKCRPYKGYNKN